MAEIKYYKKYTGKSGSIVDALSSIGVKDTSLSARKKIASANGIKNYSGTAEQNTLLLDKLKKGKLIKPSKNEFKNREKFIGFLQKYNKGLKEYGNLIFYSFSKSEKTYDAALKKLKKGQKTGLTCVVPCRWALKDTGINPSGFYCTDGTFAHCYKGDVKKHLKRITSGGPIGLTAKKAVKNKELVNGDIIAYKGRTHTFVFSGESCKMYDGGHAANYEKTGILVDYTNDKSIISEVLRWID